MPLVAHVRPGRKGEKGDLEGQDKISEGQVKIKPTPLDNAKTLSVSSSGRRKGVIQHILLWETRGKVKICCGNAKIMQLVNHIRT
jgi:hypothetical protein